MSDPQEESDDLESLLNKARRRLMRLEIEKHRTKAEVARLEAIAEGRAADELARLLRDHSNDLEFAIALAAYRDRPGRGRIPIGTAAPPEPTLPDDNGSAARTVPLDVPCVPMANPIRRIDPPHNADNSSHGPAPSESCSSRPTESVDAPRLPSLNGRPVPAAKAARNRKSAAVGRSKRRRHPAGKARSRRRTRRNSRAFITSAIVHVVVLVVLGFISIAAALSEPEPMLLATLGVPSETIVAELPEVEIVPPAEADLEMPDPLAVDPAPAELDPISPPSAVEAESLPDTAAGEFAFAELPLGDSALLDAAGGDGNDGDGSGEGGAALPAANFFGAEARASRIVFIVDNSNSMDEGRFATALLELARSVDALAASQSFYVIFYSDTAYRLFHPAPEESLVPATPENKARLRAWLQTAEMCVGGQVVDAFEIAADLKPQMVFLLSDGVIGRYPVSYLTQQRDWRFTVHTVGMTVPDREAAENLMAVARANGGIFRSVGVSPLAREMARRRPIRKNRTRGPVWGIELPLP